MAPLQSVLAAFELSLLLIGAFCLLRAVATPARRQAWFGSNAIPPWALTGFEVMLLILLVFLCGFTGQFLAIHFFASHVKASPDRAGLEVLVYGAALHGSALVGWPLFARVRRWMYADYGAVAAVVTPSPRLPLPQLLGSAFIAFVAALPAIAVVSLGWTWLLRKLGLPDEPQDLVEIFNNTRSPFILTGMLLVACVLAPINEELIFRAGIFRALRQRYGRRAALLVSAVAFGALHGNWAGFLPLALFGAALALAYEKTGDIRVSIFAHACFNLNTILVIFSGLPNL